MVVMVAKLCLLKCRQIFHQRTQVLVGNSYAERFNDDERTRFTTWLFMKLCHHIQKSSNTMASKAARTLWYSLQPMQPLQSANITIGELKL